MNRNIKTLEIEMEVDASNLGSVPKGAIAKGVNGAAQILMNAGWTFEEAARVLRIEQRLEMPQKWTFPTIKIGPSNPGDLRYTLTPASPTSFWAPTVHEYQQQKSMQELMGKANRDRATSITPDSFTIPPGMFSPEELENLEKFNGKLQSYKEKWVAQKRKEDYAKAEKVVLERLEQGPVGIEEIANMLYEDGRGIPLGKTVAKDIAWMLVDEERAIFNDCWLLEKKE